MNVVAYYIVSCFLQNISVMAETPLGIYNFKGSEHPRTLHSSMCIQCIVWNKSCYVIPCK